MARSCTYPEQGLVPEDYYMDYYCSSFIESVKWWFRTGLKIAPEELTGYFVRVTG